MLKIPLLHNLGVSLDNRAHLLGEDLRGVLRNGERPEGE